MMLVFEQSFASLRNASFLSCCKDIRSPSQSIEVDCISCGLMLDTSCAKEWRKWPVMDVKTQYRQSLCVRWRTWSANMSGMDFPLLKVLNLCIQLLNLDLQGLHIFTGGVVLPHEAADVVGTLDKKTSVADLLLVWVSDVGNVALQLLQHCLQRVLFSPLLVDRVSA